MADGRYVRSYPVVLALVLDDVDSALWFAQQVDEGERYLPLLREYDTVYESFSPAVEQAIKTGEYQQAAALLTQEPHDLFLRALLLYLEGKSPTDVREQLRPQLPAGLLQDLLTKLL